MVINLKGLVYLKMKKDCFSNDSINTSDWKKINIEYLGSFITVEVPPSCDALQMKSVPPLQNIPETIEQAFEHPIQKLLLTRSTISF